MHQCIDKTVARVHILPIETIQPLTRASRIDLLFNNLRNTNKDGTASTATGDQIAPEGYQREAHLDG